MARISSTSGTSARDRELEITEKFLHPHHLLVHKVENRDSARDSASTSTGTRDRDRASTSTSTRVILAKR